MKSFLLTSVALLGLLSLSPGDEPAKPAPTPTPATKGTLPRDFKKLGLTDAQKIAVEKITGEARSKVADLEAQITSIREQEHKDALAVLTDAQRQQLKAILTAGVDDKPAPTPPAAPTPPTPTKP